MLAIVAMLAVQFTPKKPIGQLKVAFSRTNPVLQGVALGLAFLAIDTLGPTGVAPFIYFQF